MHDDQSERAEQALRKGRPREALALYRKLLEHDKTDGRALRGAGSTGRRRPTWRSAAGGRPATCCWRCGRYAEAQRHFPVEGAAARVGVLRGAAGPARRGGAGASRRRGHPALAAIELEAAGAAAAARLEWERVLRDERLAGRPYETALAHFNLGEALLRIGDRAGGLRELGAAARCWRWWPTTSRPRGEPRARVRLLQRPAAAGKAMGSFETVAEGYLNVIRDPGRPTTSAGGRSTTTTSRATPSRARSGTRRRWRRARWPSTACGSGWPRIATTSSAPPSCGSRRRARTRPANGPLDLSANAFQAAIDAATALGDLALARSHLRRARGAAAAPRRGGGATGAGAALRGGAAVGALPAPAFPAVLRRQRELHGHLARRPGRVGAGRRAGRGAGPADRRDAAIGRSSRGPRCARCSMFADPSFSPTNLPAVAEAAEAVGGVPAYEMLRAARAAVTSTRRPRCGRRSCGAPARC